MVLGNRIERSYDGIDWIGNSFSTLQNIGARNHATSERAKRDFYATEPKAVRLLLEKVQFEGEIWECACGNGDLSKEMERLGYDVYSSDIIIRDYDCVEYDFLSMENIHTDKNIITNPPYKLANQFIRKALEITEIGKKIAFLLPIRYITGKERKGIFNENPPLYFLVSSGSLKCALNGDFAKKIGNALEFAWFVWEKGYKGETILRWFN